MLCLVLLMGLTGLQAQESISASGGNAVSSDGSVSYTVGQVVYSTYLGSDGSVAEGVQQPYEISIVTGLDRAKTFNLKCMAYPNPTKDHLTLKVENFVDQDLFYQLYDLKGKLLKNKKVMSDKSSIAMGKLEPSIYFLKITKGQKEMIVFKIVKN